MKQFKFSLLRDIATHCLGEPYSKYLTHGRKLRWLRYLSRASITDVAAHAGVSPGVVDAAERGGPLAYEELRELARVYGFEAHRLIDVERQEYGRGLVLMEWALDKVLPEPHPGHAIRSAREALGASQEELADASGIARETLSRIESRKREPSRATLHKIRAGVDRMWRSPWKPGNADPPPVPCRGYGEKLERSADYWASYYCRAFGLSWDLEYDIKVDALAFGYTDAARDFDPEHPSGASFETYADHKIRHRAEQAALRLSREWFLGDLGIIVAETEDGDIFPAWESSEGDDDD